MIGLFLDSKFKYILIFLLLLSLQQFALCKDISVCETGCDFSNINKAINSAAPGDTLRVHSGIYKENVNVSKPITLIGQDTGSDRPVIDAHENGSALAIFADGAIVEGFNLTNAMGSGVEVLAGIEVNSNHNTLKDNLAFNNENGIFIVGGDNIVQNNTASSNIYGIRAEDSENNFINDNVLRNNNYGLFLMSSANNTIQRNQVIDNQFGILINQSAGNNLTRNLMTGNYYNFGAHGDNHIDKSNLADGKLVYYLVGADGQLIDPSSDAATVYCINCRNLTVRGLELKNSFYGIYLENSSHSLLQGNNLSNNRIGSALVKSYYNSLISNQAQGNAEGFLLSASRYNTLQDNAALKNQAGLHLVYSDYNRVLDNQFRQNERGLWLMRSSENLLSGNDLASNSLGGEFEFSWRNQLSSNNVSDNFQGILLDSSSENNLSANKIFNNLEGILYDPLDKNSLGADNLYWNNTANLTEIRTRTTAGTIQSSTKIFIISNPMGAVIVNGDQEIEVPGPAEFVDPGKYDVYVKMRGYKDEKLTINIPASPETLPESMSEMSVDLVPEENL